ERHLPERDQAHPGAQADTRRRGSGRRDGTEVRNVSHVSRVRQIGHGTDTGKKRRRNEDTYVVEPPLFAIADGMGGAQAGELASSLAAGAVRGDEGAAGSGERRFTELIHEANRRVYQRSSQDAAASGMGTTMTVAFVGDANVAFGHVGDSRAYLIRDGKLEQLTEDHSLVAELVRTGKLSPEEAGTHPQRSVITRALGTGRARGRRRRPLDAAWKISGEPAKPRAAEPGRSRGSDRTRLCERLHRPPVGRLDRLALLRGVLPRALPRRTPGRALRGAVRRPV